MAHIPQVVSEKNPPIPGLPLIGMGKVRNSHNLPGHGDKILVYASKRVSAYDVVLPTDIEQKGEVLTAMNHFWNTLLSPFFKTDMIACGGAIDQYLPESLRGNADIQKCGTVVKRLYSPDVEDIVRFHLTGSGFKDYKKTGIVSGHRLPPGLFDGNELPTPLYTPSTKAMVGHDENISIDSVIKRYGYGRVSMMLMAARMMHQYAMKQGIIIADMKAEIYEDVLIDEKGTPDCCRFWDHKAWMAAQAKGKLPPSLDKQYVRNECIRLGIDKLDPKNPEHLAIVDELKFSENVRLMTTRLYRYILWRMAHKILEKYQREDMGIAVEVPRRKIEILIGSKSDSEQIEAGLDFLKGVADVNLRVLSCHRNLNELGAVAEQIINHADVVIAGAGMAAALPGIMKSQLCMLGHPEIPVIGVAFKGKSERDDQAAVLSIERLPGEPVELDLHGNAYFGNVGFIEACRAAIGHEFLPKDIERKPSELVFKRFP